MFMNATVVVKTVIVGPVPGLGLLWFLLITKLLEMGNLNRESDKFLEAFRGARSVSDINRIATSDEFRRQPDGRHGRRRRDRGGAFPPAAWPSRASIATPPSTGPTPR